jgi:hypothetical protein
MYKKFKLFFIIPLFILSLFTLIPSTSHAQQQILTRQSIQFGYWEIVPAINNILTDWTVAKGVFSGTRGTVEGDTVRVTVDPYIAATTRNYIIDPDGDKYTEWESRPGVTQGKAANLYIPKTEAQLWDEILAGVPADQKQAAKDKLLSTNSNVWFWAAQRGIAPYTLLGYTAADSLFRTHIYRSAPPVGFSVGNVYLSDPMGNHWSLADGGIYPNVSTAVDYLADWQIIPNYEKDVTYIYREIPYSVKVCFWTQGYADIPKTQPSKSFLLQGFYYQDGGPIGFGSNAPYWIPSKTALASFDWVNESYIDADPVTANLNFEIIAPLWTSRASELIRSPNGDYQATFNNTWIGFLDAYISNIQGGLINPAVDVPDPPQSMRRGIVGTVDGLPNMEVTSARASAQVIQQGNRRQVVTPTPSQAGVTNRVERDPNIESTSTPGWQSTQFTTEEGGVIAADDFTSDDTGIRYRGFPKILEGNLVADPNYYEPYFLSANLAMGSSIGNVQDEYITIWGNQTYQGVAGLTNGKGTVQQLGFVNAQANYVNFTTIKSDVTNVNRKYAEDIPLSADIPNSQQLSIGATLKPAVHTWYKNINWIYKEFGDQVWSWNNRHTQLRTRGENTLSVVAGQEILNVWMTFTVTLTVAVIDRYDNDFVPGTNKYAGWDMTPWIKMNLHGNTYDEKYEWTQEFYSTWPSIFGNWFWIIFGVAFAILWYQGGSSKISSAEKIVTGPVKIKRTSAYISALPRALILAFIIAFVISAVLWWFRLL